MSLNGLYTKWIDICSSLVTFRMFFVILCWICGQVTPVCYEPNNCFVLSFDLNWVSKKIIVKLINKKIVCFCVLSQRALQKKHKIKSKLREVIKSNNNNNDDYNN